MNRMMMTLAAAMLGLALAGTAQAQQSHDHNAMPAMKAKASDTAATKAFKEVGMTMHKDMAISYSGDADVDFVRGMIPHHQGAIDMAKVVLAHGKDPDIRKLAENIVRDQEQEIALMRDWLKKHGK